MSQALSSVRAFAGSPAPRPSWGDLSVLEFSSPRMRRNRIVAADRSDPSYVAIDMLRTRLMSDIRERHWSTLAITSPRGGCGKTTLALNLAFSFAQQSDFRVGLLDLDLRRPSLARVLGQDEYHDIEGFLRGQRSMVQSVMRHRDRLALVLNIKPVSDAAELLMACVPGAALTAMREALGLDLVIFDLAPMLAADDTLAILPAVDAALLVAAAGETTMNEISACERDLSQYGKLAGIVLNKCRYLPERYGY